MTKPVIKIAIMDGQRKIYRHIKYTKGMLQSEQTDYDICATVKSREQLEVRSVNAFNNTKKFIVKE